MTLSGYSRLAIMTYGKPVGKTMSDGDVVFVIGARGHGKSVVGVLRASGFEVSAIFDDDPDTWGESILGVKVDGPILENIDGESALALIGIGENADRKAQAEKLTSVEWLTLVYPGAYINPSARIGPGSVVFPGAVVGADVIVGRHVIVSANCTIGHDTQVEDYAHLAPGVQVAGGVSIREGAMLGIGCCVAPKIVVGDWAIVGAGSTVVRDVAPRVTVLGVAATER